MKATIWILALWCCLAAVSIGFLTVDCLSTDFTIISGKQGSFELVWSSTTPSPIRVGASRYEFRTKEGSIVGYPREVDGKLVLTLSNKQQELLSDESSNINLEVWKSGQRIDSGSKETLPPGSKVDISKSYDTVLPTTPTLPVNPAQRGSFSTRRSSYDLEPLQIDEYPASLEVLGEVIDPRFLRRAAPLILFLHGRHITCYDGGPDASPDVGWPCPDGQKPVPSHQGYRYIANILASQGNIVVSISANGINAQDFSSVDAGASSRSILIRHHLALWAKWNVGGDPWGGRFRGRLNMTQVVLVGHSRGGEGVHKAAIDASQADPYKIVGLVSYGPTAFGRQVTPDIHSATILPTCDGDVSDLQGQAYVDSSRDISYSEALRSAIISVGANHNFFNTEWTPGLAVAPSFDDWYNELDPVCGNNVTNSYRLSPEEQQTVGAIYTAALVKLAIHQDLSMLPFLDGSFVRPEAMGRAEVGVNAVGGANHRYLYLPVSVGAPSLQNGMTGGECTDDFNEQSGNLPICRDSSFYGDVAPHWQSPPSHRSMELAWLKKNASVKFTVRSALSNLSAHDWVDARIANDPNEKGAQLDLVVIDKSGKSATLQSNMTTIEGWPAVSGNFDYDLDRIHARTLRGSLKSVKTKVDLSQIEAVVLVTRSGPGKAWVLDIAASQAQIKTPLVLDLPKVSFENAVLVEYSIDQKPSLKLIADKPLTTPGLIELLVGSRAFKLALTPNASTNVVGEIPLDLLGVENDNIYSLSIGSTSAQIYAINGVVTGNYTGSFAVTDDEPLPTVTAVSTTVVAPEGQSLQWTLKLSGPTAGLTIYFTVVEPTSGTELTTYDVSLSWLQSLNGFRDSTPTPLSQSFLRIPVRFDYGETKSDLFIPIKSDQTKEGSEKIVLELVTDPSGSTDDSDESDDYDGYDDYYDYYEDDAIIDKPEFRPLTLIGIVRANS